MKAVKCCKCKKDTKVIRPEDHPLHKFIAIKCDDCVTHKNIEYTEPNHLIEQHFGGEYRG